MARYLHRTYLVLYQFAIQVGVRTTSLSIEFKGYLDVGHLAAQLVLLDAVVGKQAIAQGVERDAAIHGSCVNIYIAHFAGQVLGHCAFAARTVAVNSYCNLFHIFLTLNS